jgi:hypothetical protein
MKFANACGPTRRGADGSKARRRAEVVDPLRRAAARAAARSE